jgi:hypothetical protein
VAALCDLDVRIARQAEQVSFVADVVRQAAYIAVITGQQKTALVLNQDRRHRGELGLTER